VKKDDLIPYHKYVLRLLDRLKTIKPEHISRSANKMVDAIANLAATLAPGTKENITIPVCG